MRGLDQFGEKFSSFSFLFLSDFGFSRARLSLGGIFQPFSLLVRQHAHLP